MAEFTHAGIEITFNETNGKFSATYKGKKLIKASFYSMKAAIDAGINSDFTPFTALKMERGYGGNKLIPVKVVGMIQVRRRGKYEPKFIDDKDLSYWELYVDTADNLAAIKAVAAHEKETKRLNDLRLDEVIKLEEKIKVIKVESYQK